MQFFTPPPVRFLRTKPKTWNHLSRCEFKRISFSLIIFINIFLSHYSFFHQYILFRYDVIITSNTTVSCLFRWQSDVHVYQLGSTNSVWLDKSLTFWKLTCLIKWFNQKRGNRTQNIGVTTQNLFHRFIDALHKLRCYIALQFYKGWLFKCQFDSLICIL